jgi:hypothetical protein
MASDSIGNPQTLSRRPRVRWEAHPHPSRTTLSFVGHRKPIPPFGPAALQNDSAILGRHPGPEAMCLFPVAGIWLVRTLTLHDVLSVMKYWPAGRRPNEFFILAECIN